MNDAGHHELTAWIRRLGASEMPIFARTLHEVSGVAERQESSAGDLANAIGRDASLAARLLRVANSPMFNPQSRRIETISTAVVMVGFDAVRELAVSLALIEQVLKGRRHAKVSREMSRAFHAAAQARAFAAGRRDRSAEEVFVAALLLRIGEMAFWSVADQEGSAIESLVASGVAAAEAQRKVLGFTLDALTRRLVDEWHLGGLVEEVLSGQSTPRVADVRLGHEVARAVERSGWRAARVSRVIDQVTAHLGVPRARAMALVHSNAQEAAKIAAWYGVPAIESYLLESEPPPRPVAPDAAFQLDVLKRIAETLDGPVDLDELVLLVLHGVQRGVGMTRTFFGLLSPSGTSLQVKHILGGGRPGLVPLGTTATGDLFRAALESGKLVHVTEQNHGSMDALFTDAIRDRTAVPFVIMPIRAGERPVGLLYGDRSAHGEAIDAETLSAFRHFGQQISLALSSTPP